MLISLPEKMESESITEYAVRSVAVVSNALVSMGIDPDSAYPITVGDACAELISGVEIVIN